MPYRLQGNCVQVQRSGAWYDLKCHENIADARSHLTALNMNVDKAHKMTTKEYSIRLFTQEETDYNSVSPQMGEQMCANCRWFRPTDEEYGAYCHVIEPYPDPILATGWCNQWIERPPLEMGDHMVREVSEEEKPKPDGETEKREYIAPPPPKPNLLQRAFGRKELQPLTIIKRANQPRLAIVISSNGFKDREDEHIAQQSLKEYVDMCYDADGTYIGDNRFDYWHDHRLDMGDITLSGIVDGFLVEVVKENTRSPIAEALWDYWERTAADASVTWGASIEFMTYNPSDGVHTTIRKSRTALLSIEAAANLYTYSGVVPNMSEKANHFDAAMKAKFGIEDASKILEKEGVAALAARLSDAGQTAKATDEQPVKTEDEQQAGKFDGLLELVGELIELTTQQDSKINAQDDEIKSLRDSRQKAQDEHTQELSELEARIKAVEGVLQETPRASRDGKAPSEDQTAELKKQAVTADPFFGNAVRAEE